MLIAGAGWAQVQRPLPPGSPEVFTAPSVRVSVVVHEDLDPDYLRRLARSDVTVWLLTRSNSLRASTLENLARFDEAFVQLRAPLTGDEVRVLSRLPKIGVWVEVRQLAVIARLPGPRRVALEVTGALDAELAERLSGAKPSVVRWSPGAEPDLLQWSLFRQLPGRKIIVLAPSALRAATCAERAPGLPSIELDLASALTVNSDVLPCGRAPRVVVRPGIDHTMLQSLVLRDPSVEIVVVIGRDEKAASETKLLLDLLDRHDSR